MRRYLLDAGPLAAFFNNRQWALTLIGPWLREREVATSIVVYGEVVEYLRGRLDYPHRRAQLRALLRQVRPDWLTDDVLERYADIRRQLRPPHGPGLIGDVDTLIAATALERNLTLVTADRDFQRVPQLQMRLIAL